jgi:hypothetical protein
MENMLTKVRQISVTTHHELQLDAMPQVPNGVVFRPFDNLLF